MCTGTVSPIIWRLTLWFMHYLASTTYLLLNMHAHAAHVEWQKVAFACDRQLSSLPKKLSMLINFLQYFLSILGGSLILYILTSTVCCRFGIVISS